MCMSQRVVGPSQSGDPQFQPAQLYQLQLTISEWQQGLRAERSSMFSKEDTKFVYQVELDLAVSNEAA